MKKLLFTLILSILFLNTSYAQSSSSLSRLVKRFEDLKISNTEKAQTIKRLESEIKRILSDQNSYSRVYENEVKKKTLEILRLRGELLSVQAEYNLVIDELNLLQGQNAVYESTIKQLESERGALNRSLQASNAIIDDLTIKLQNSRYSNQLLIAENDALKQRLNEIFGIQNRISFVGVNTSTGFGPELSITHGILSKGNNLFTGLKLSYAQYRYSKSNEVPFIELLQLNASLKVPISRRNFGYYYIKKSTSVFTHIKYFLSVDAGWSRQLSGLNVINYSSGLNWSLGVGAIIPTLDNVGAYLYMGLKGESFNIDFQNVNGDENLVAFQLGVGANF